MFLYIKTNILRGYGIFKNDFAHPREPANAALTAGHLQPDTVICDQYSWTNQSFSWFSSFYKHYVSNDENNIILN